MPVKYVPYYPETIDGQAILDNFVRTRRMLRYKGSDQLDTRIKRGMPFYEVDEVEQVNGGGDNLLIRGECVSACAYLKDNGIKVDVVYIDPPFASGADYAKKIYLRSNPRVAEALAAGTQLNDEDGKILEEKLYGDIWNKEQYLNWMYENLIAINGILSEKSLVFVHLGVHISHYVKVLLDEVFGESNFRNELTVKRIKKNIREREFVRALNAATDIVYVYATDESVQILPPMRPEIKGERWHGFEAAGFRNGMDYDLLGHLPKSTEHWRWEESKARAAVANYDEWKELDDNESLTEYWIRTGKAKDFIRPNYTSCRPEYFLPASEEVLCDSLWDDISAYSFKHDYSTEKSPILLERILKMVPGDNLTVADFFSGSGVTASVAATLNHRFIASDVGGNALLTTRDRLAFQGSAFEVLDIKDGVSLFRNPIQTMDRLKDLIVGLRNEDKLDAFWEGAITTEKDGMVPVYVPNLVDHSSKILDLPMMNRILNEAMPDLPDDVTKVIVYYIDMENEKELRAFISSSDSNTIKVELRDLKEVLDNVVVNDAIDYTVTETAGGHTIEFNNFVSDRLQQKIDEYNQKRKLQAEKKGLLEIAEFGSIEAESNGDRKTIEISDNGLELIEWVSLDCTNKTGSWKSDAEIKIDKNSYVTCDGKKTKDFWDGKIVSKKKPHRLKVRNIAGDESEINV